MFHLICYCEWNFIWFESKMTIFKNCMCKSFFDLLQKIVFYDWLPALLDLTPEEIEENKYSGK